MFSTWMELKAESPVREEHRLFQELNSEEHQGTEISFLGQWEDSKQGDCDYINGVGGEGFFVWFGIFSHTV